MAERAKKDNVVVATYSFARNKVEEDTIFESLRKLRQKGYPVVLSDGGSPRDFVERLETLGVKVLNGKGLGPTGGQRQAVQAAYESERPIIAYFASDKLNVPNELHKIIRIVETGDAEIATGKRPWKVMRQLPAVQRFEERVGNKMVGVAAGRQVDSYYGVFAFNRSLAPIFIAYEDNKFKGKSWGRDFYFIVRSAREGHRIASVKINAPYSKENMRGEELRRGAGFTKGTPAGNNINYRWQQFMQVMHGVKQAMRDAKPPTKKKSTR